MPSVFPDFLTYGLLAPLILRLALGFIFINFGRLALTGERDRWLKLFDVIRLRPAKIFEKIFGFVEIVGGILLVIGLYTQVAALVFSIISLAELILEYREPVLLKNNIYFYILLFAISLSLIFLGAGFLAFDLPL